MAWVLHFWDRNQAREDPQIWEESIFCCLHSRRGDSSHFVSMAIRPRIVFAPTQDNHRASGHAGSDRIRLLFPFLYNKSFEMPSRVSFPWIPSVFLAFFAAIPSAICVVVDRSGGTHSQANLSCYCCSSNHRFRSSDEATIVVSEFDSTSLYSQYGDAIKKLNVYDFGSVGR
jgi:hypothetical protein